MSMELEFADYSMMNGVAVSNSVNGNFGLDILHCYKDGTIVCHFECECLNEEIAHKADSIVKKGNEVEIIGKLKRVVSGEGLDIRSEIKIIVHKIESRGIV